MSADWRVRCEELLADADGDLIAAVGDASLCAISKSGDRVDGVKYLEGRSAALREYRRELTGTTGDAAHGETNSSSRWTATWDRTGSPTAPGASTPSPILPSTSTADFGATDAGEGTPLGPLTMFGRMCGRPAAWPGAS